MKLEFNGLESEYFFNCIRDGVKPDLSSLRSHLYYPQLDHRKIDESIEAINLNDSIPSDVQGNITKCASSLLIAGIKRIFQLIPNKDDLFQKLDSLIETLCVNSDSIVLMIQSKFIEYRYASIAQKWIMHHTGSIVTFPSAFSLRYESIPELLLPISVAIRLDEGQASEKIQRTLHTYYTQNFEILKKVCTSIPGLFPDYMQWNQIRNSDIHGSTTYDAATGTFIFRDKNKPDLCLSIYEFLLLCMHLYEAYNIVVSYNFNLIIPWFIAIYAHAMSHSNEALGKIEKFASDMHNVRVLARNTKE